MNLNILKATITLVRNQLLAALLCLLMVIVTLSVISLNRKWTDYKADMTKVFREAISEVRIPNITLCAAHASRKPLANLACHKDSRCVFGPVLLLRVKGEQTDGFTCWYSQVCSHGQKLLWENETVSVSDPPCHDTRTLKCSMQGLFFTDVPLPRTTCTAPFTQHPFGCMYDSQEFNDIYCEARRYCEEKGANLASPETEKDTADMMSYYTNKHAVIFRHYVGLFKIDGVFTWPANQRKYPKGDNWGPPNPDDQGPAVIMYNRQETYRLGDVNFEGYKANVVCHVWVVY